MLHGLERTDGAPELLANPLDESGDAGTVGDVQTAGQGPAAAGETLLTEMSDAELLEVVSLDVTRAAVE